MGANKRTIEEVERGAIFEKFRFEIFYLHGCDDVIFHAPVCVSVNEVYFDREEQAVEFLKNAELVSEECGYRYGLRPHFVPPTVKYDDELDWYVLSYENGVMAFLNLVLEYMVFA